ncbi:hypothetical protein [Pseudactinotalea suaedae]|uniref:hypothetical protein n=1 Tax=Pseudactinotalea suaedae TaxID=1524924 RepID=UPI0012E23BCA|nr:hypothetical protein [Pseudactinotalea suaedae]
MLRRLLAVIAVVAAAALVTGCGAVRWESEDPPTQSAGPDERVRQEHAEQAQHLADLAQAAAATDAALAPLLDAVAQDALAQLDVLGGVWRSSGRHLEPATPQGDAADVQVALVEAATAAREAAVISEAGLAEVLAGIAVSRSLRSDQLAAALGTDPVAVEPALPAALDPAASVDLVRTLDALGQAWEIAAARAEDAGPAAAEALAWRERAQQLAEVTGVADTPEDPRAVSYDLDATDLAATIADLEADLMPCWLAQVATTADDDRRAVIDLALSAARAAGLADPDAPVPAIAGH